MKKIYLVSIISIIFFSLSSLVAYTLKFSDTENKWVFFGLGIALILISALLALFFHEYKTMNITCLIMNSISLGFLIRAWHMYCKYDNSLIVLLLVSLGVTLLIWLYYLLLFIPFFNRHPVLLTILFIILIVTLYIIIMCNTSTSYMSTFGFYMIVVFAFIIAMCVKVSSYSELISSMLIATYSIILVAIIMGLLMLAGDGADFDLGLDGSSFGGDVGGVEKKKQRKELEKEMINDLSKII